MSPMKNDYFVTCPKGLEGLLADELRTLGTQDCRETIAGVYFTGDLADAYRVCLWSRLANRVLLPLTKCEVMDERALYRGVAELLWEKHVHPDSVICVDFIGANDAIRNTQFGAQVVKDAIVDRVRDVTGERPSVSKSNPDLRINVRLARNIAYVSLDLSGDSLHRRGYRLGQGGAPLKENLAAAVLLRSGWSEIAKAGGSLIDPMCGSGTFLIEAAYIAADIAPGILREKFGFEGWAKFNPEDWEPMKADAIERKEQGLSTFNLDLFGYDIDPRVIDAAEQNAAAAGLSSHLNFMVKSMHDLKKPTHKPVADGLLICNPPYGERLGEINALRDDYLALATVAKAELPGWQMGIFTGNADLGKAMRLRPKKKYKLFNGTIASELLLFDILSAAKATLRQDAKERSGDVTTYAEKASAIKRPEDLSAGATMVANRLKKNNQRLSKWAKKNAITCFRLYDADMPEYSAAVDIYGDKIHVQEYQAPRSIDELKAEARFQELLDAISCVFELSPSDIFVKTRKRNKGKSQYEKFSADRDNDERDFFEVQEGDARLLINLSDYLDTGLFLDHRPLRQMIAANVARKSFLNLFCYTASATTLAALGGAKSSVSVDMSNTYLDWAKRNFTLNNIRAADHQLVRADVFQWIKDCRQGFDVIMLDPPTFSNSKKMDDVLDVQKDHVALIRRCMELLNPGGTLYFSNNMRSFKMDVDGLFLFDLTDITRQTIDMDFSKNTKIHHCWKIQAK